MPKIPPPQEPHAIPPESAPDDGGAPGHANGPATPPQPGGFHNWAWWLGVVAVLIAFDHAVKLWAVSELAPRLFDPTLPDSIPIIPGLFRLTYAENTGAAFSLLDGRVGFLAIVSAVATIALTYWWTRIPKEESLGRAGVALVLAGTVGNLIDRAFRGFVVDMFDAYYRGYSWPVFNVADSLICVGVGILILRTLQGKI